MRHEPKKAFRRAAAIDLPKHLPTGLREQIEAAIKLHQDAVEGLIGILDRVDGDPDSEPSLGFSPFGCSVDGTDREGDDVQDEPHDQVDEGNSEPSLAHTNDFNQEIATKHLGTVLIGDTWVDRGMDLEVEHDGREPEEDAEHDGREPEEGL